MLQKKKIEKLKQEIDDSCDARLESKLWFVLAQGFTSNDFFIAPNGFFYRPYSKDVLHSEIIEDTNNISLLQLNTTQRGIYDQLPEGLFYQPVSEMQPVRNSADMAEDYKRNKRNEQAARRFFMPLENDFFLKRIQLKQEEYSLVQGIDSDITYEYFINFWELDSSIPILLLKRLMLLLPYASLINGNLNITAACIQKLINEDVYIAQKYTSQLKAEHIVELGNIELGINSMCGNVFSETDSFLLCSIGPLQNSSVADYIESGYMNTFLKTIYRFFIPVHVDVVTNIEIQQQKKKIILKTGQQENSILGYSSFL